MAAGEEARGPGAMSATSSQEAWWVGASRQKICNLKIIKMFFK